MLTLQIQHPEHHVLLLFISQEKWCFSQLLVFKWAATWQNQQNGMRTQQRLRSGWAFVQSDQSLRCVLNEKLRTQTFFMRTAKTDQTGLMPRLIWVFAGCTCYFVSFVMLRLKYGYVFVQFKIDHRLVYCTCTCNQSYWRQKHNIRLEIEFFPLPKIYTLLCGSMTFCLKPKYPKRYLV